ncbi:aspartate/glutamate racemase family protein [Amycolatopsis sp. FDAARGOS 1241]|uniref:aspartate/glutamate racemase family protein n=1 Tax=Amycolatopsis sp. FDAARGOS 1241 TaxID=2778070 RepID=UPI00194E9B9D|nr:aspartate/glutamate racemase family protein [Amycolatopsis sp. FDAARGOS 1241]QRP47510.1 aspartate/glutamate racemase family protein [Amycolatopsis sp. FDAARGOS 1241]
MKTIGLLGGMSWESSAEYYRLVNSRVREALGGYHSARVVLYSVDFAEIEALQSSGDWVAAGQALAAAASALAAAGADVIVLCTNTMHKVASSLEVGVPFLHLGGTTAAAVRAAGVSRVGLLGTAFTMSQPFYRERLAAHGLSVLAPSDVDQQRVHRVIYDELVQGVVLPASREAYRGVISRLVEAGAEGVIYGCTEIELLVDQSDSPVPAFPTTRLHAEAAVDWALGLRELPPAPV